MAREVRLGALVEYRMPSGAWRPAMVVHLWGPAISVVNLQVFTDGRNDASLPGQDGHNVQWATSVPHWGPAPTAEHAPAWRWPEEAEP